MVWAKERSEEVWALRDGTAPIYNPVIIYLHVIKKEISQKYVLKNIHIAFHLHWKVDSDQRIIKGHQSSTKVIHIQAEVVWSCFVLLLRVCKSKLKIWLFFVKSVVL